MPDKLDKVTQLTKSINLPNKGLVKLKDTINIEDYDVLVQNIKENKTYKVSSSLFGTSSGGGTILFPNGFENVTESRDFLHTDIGKALRLAADDVFLTMPEGQFWTEEEKGKVIVVIADAVNVGFDKTFETPVLMQSRDGDNSMVGEYCLLVTGETDGQSDFGTISTAVIKDGDDWKTAIRYLYDNSGGGSSALVPTNDEIAMNIRLLFPNEFTDVGGNIWEYALQQEDAGKLIIMYIDADVYPDEYRVTIPDDLCIGLPNEIMKVGFFVVDGNCWWQNGSGGGFVKQLSLADAVNVVNTGSGGEGAFVIFTATEGATIASVDVTLINKQGTYYTPDYWQFRNDLYLHPIVEGASYHLKEGKNVLYSEGSSFDEITIYVDSNINFKYEEVEVLIAGATIANVIWKDNDDDETDIGNTYGLPSSMKGDDFVRLKNQTGNDFVVLENYKKSIPLSGTISGSPVTGDVEVNARDVSRVSFYAKDGDNNTGNFDFADDGTVGLRFTLSDLSESRRLFIGIDGIKLFDDNIYSHGLTGVQDFTQNLVALDYTQKKYVGYRGTATLSSGTVTVSTTDVHTGWKIYVSVNTPSGSQGFLSASTADIVDGTSFVINSTDSGDNSTVNWWIAP